MDIKEVRRQRLRKLILVRFGGKQSAFAEAVGRSPSYVARLVAGGDGHGRNLGESLAREIESLCNIPTGFLDVPLTDVEVAGFFDPSTNPPGAELKDLPPELLPSELPPRLAQKIDAYKDHISIPVMDVAASMGAGVEPPEVEVVASSLKLEMGWLRRTIPMTDPDNLRVVTGMGESMAPTISHGDLLIADVGVNDISYDGVYLLLMHNVLLVKRVQRSIDGFIIISDNPRYKEIAVPGEFEERVKILGRIVYIWNGHKT